MAPIDRNTRPADPARSWRGQKGDNPTNFLCPAKSSEWQFPTHELGHAVGILLLAPMPRSTRKGNRSGCHAIHADVVLRQLLRHRLGEADLSGLHRVVGHPTARLSTPNGSDHDDHPPASAPHVGNGGA